MVLSSFEVKTFAFRLGFSLIGIARAQPSPMLAAYERWVAAGMHGEMGYLAREDRLVRRRDLNLILPGARSLLIVGVDYQAHVPASVLRDPTRGRIASYAWGVDYHHWIATRLETLALWMLDTYALERPYKVYVDTGAILERSHAQTAGMGFIGKNTMLIHPRKGSYFLLGEIITSAQFDHYDAPLKKATMCGSCTRCLSACPTDAFPAPHVLDARRCISYLTIEHKGWINPELRPLMGNWVFGCDVCQEVCPFQRFSTPTPHTDFVPVDFKRAAPPLSDLLSLDDEQFKRIFAGSPVERIKRERLVRNACIAAGNSRDPSLIPLLENALDDRSALVRGHAAWALRQLNGMHAKTQIKRALTHEDDHDVRREYARLIE